MSLDQTIRIFALVILITGVSACGGTGGKGSGEKDDAVSKLCANVTGREAIIWDLYNGVIRTDVDVLPPPIPPVGGSFSHPSNPLLHFIYPPGWNPETIDFGIHNLGVNLIRQDSQAVWREQSQSFAGVPLARDLRDFEIDQLLGFLELQPPVQELCTRDGTAPVGGGILNAFSNVMFRVGGHTALIATSVTPFPGLPTSSLRVKMVASPTAEFPRRAIDTFIAIDWQMLIGDSSNLFDRDGDGWLDGLDAHPDDPTRH